MKNLVFSIAALLSISLAAMASDDSIFGNSEEYGNEIVREVLLTPSAAQEVFEAEGVEIHRIVDEWGRPLVVAKLGIGLPGNVNAQLEIYVAETVTVEAGGGTGLLGHAVMGAVRWRPEATCWGCNGKRAFSIGLGAEAHALFASNETDVIIAASADAQYVRRFAKHFGLVLGLKAGVGPVAGFMHGSSGNYDAPTDAPSGPGGEVPMENGETAISDRGWTGRIEPSLTLLLYTGFSF